MLPIRRTDTNWFRRISATIMREVMENHRMTAFRHFSSEGQNDGSGMADLTPEWKV
jgi:hypothetical protein